MKPPIQKLCNIIFTSAAFLKRCFYSTILIPSLLGLSLKTKKHV